VAGQLGLALESARLYQDTQRRAAQEQLVGEVTSRMRETLDVEKVLQKQDNTEEELLREIGDLVKSCLAENPRTEGQ
jgi:GAF domain-containing protein